MFETFGHDKVKKDIELIVINNQRLYDIFFTWFYSNGFVSQDSRPKTTKGDFLHASKNSEFLDLEEEDKSYNSPIARPKTTQAIIQQREERKDDEFDLSPSQSASHKGYMLKSHQGMTIINDNGTNLGQFLTDEKNFDSITSKRPQTNFQEMDYDMIPNSARISEHKPLATSSAYNSIDHEVLKQKLSEEKDLLSKEYDDKLRKQREKSEKLLISENEKKEKLRQELENMKNINEELIDKYERTLQQNIDAVKRQKEMESRFQQEIEQKERDLQEQLKIQELKLIEEQQQLAQKQPSNLFKSLADQIHNPIDLSMSLILKEGNTNRDQSNVIVQSDPLNRLEDILVKQKGIMQSDNGHSDEDSEGDYRSSFSEQKIFKLQEFLIETDNPEDISNSLMICFMKNRTSKDKSKMLKSINDALSAENSTAQEDVLMSLTDVHFH